MMILVLVSSGLAASVLYGIDQDLKERREKGSVVAREAKGALYAYMLLRYREPEYIAVGTNAVAVAPRLLMLPCPDNVGDGNLDGSQDAYCGSRGSVGYVNMVSGILEGGSRFGRLPWRRQLLPLDNIGELGVNDGVGADFRDGWYNRLWYAVSRNMVPAKNDANYPLNLHRLMTLRKDWLAVSGDGSRGNKVAAVVIAPGAVRGKHLGEMRLENVTLDHSLHVKADDGVLSPHKFFEQTWHGEGEATVLLSNADRDGHFFRRPLTVVYDDAVEFVSVDDFARRKGYFYRAYRGFVGIDGVQNKPRRGSPLFQVREALGFYYGLFGFYPTPARLDEAGHLNTRQRHCAAFHSGDSVVTMTVGTTMALRTVSELRLTSTVATVEDGAFLLDKAFVLSQFVVAGLENTVTMTVTASTSEVPRQSASVVWEDRALLVSEMTLARYGRVRVAGTVSVSVGEGRLVSPSLFVVPAGASVGLLPTAILVVAEGTPLVPAGDLIGWFSEHSADPMRAPVREGGWLTFAGGTRGAFFSDVLLTSVASRVTVTAGSVLSLAAGGRVQFRKDFRRLAPLAGTVYGEEGTVAIDGHVPDRLSYERRQLVFWALSDGVNVWGQRTVTVRAPAVLFPWRKEARGGGLDTRDSLQAYPPCFDSRNFYGREFGTFLEDQPMVYAVAADCHYGGDAGRCGRGGGLTVSVAAGAVVALPEATVLTLGFTTTLLLDGFGEAGVSLGLGRRDWVTVVNGVVRSARPVTLAATTFFPVVSGGRTLFAFWLAEGTVLTVGATMRVERMTPLVGGEGTRLTGVPALLVYSPAPVSRALCTLGMPAGAVVPARESLTATVRLVANQAWDGGGTENVDINALCYWLDDEENADGDGVFFIPSPATRPAVFEANDYFLLLGGRLF